MWATTLAAAFLLASQVSAGILGDVRLGIRHGSIERDMRRHADLVVDDIERRQTSSSSTANATAEAAAAAANTTQWNAQTSAACETALAALNGVASNPSGMAFCYNLPFLDTTTGVFQADLRLFMISAATGDFAGVPSEDVTIGMQYIGATASMIPASQLTTGGNVEKVKRQAQPPVQQQAYAFVGQINKNLLSANLNSSSLQAILVPIITLAGVTPAGQAINTTLSPTEATFVTGVFSGQTKNITDATAAEAATIVANVPFVVPGTKILIFPIGAIITGAWTVIGMTVVMYGTIQRMGFRDSYRRRLARAEKGGVATI